MNAPARVIVAETTWPDKTLKYKLRVDDYLLLEQAGSFRGAKTELVDGDIIVMSPEWRPHLRVKSELAYLLRRAVELAGLSYFVGVEGSVALSDNDMPLPDILLTSDIGGEGAVPCESVPLLVEVSSSTFDSDIGTKAERYASAGIPEYWVVDVNGRVFHRLWSPGADGYTRHDQVALGEPLASATMAELRIETNGL